MKRFATTRGKIGAALLGGALCLAGSTPFARACELKIVWQADLSGSPSAPGAPVPSATTTLEFDFAHPGATVRISSKNLSDVQAIDLHVVRSYAEHTGPTVLHLYAAQDGPLPPAFTRHIAPSDLQPSASPKIADFTDVVQAVVNHRAYVTVATKAHPEGELSGFVVMHKEVLYSDGPADSAHDAALHHAAQRPHNPTP